MMEMYSTGRGFSAAIGGVEQSIFRARHTDGHANELEIGHKICSVNGWNAEERSYEQVQNPHIT